MAESEKKYTVISYSVGGMNNKVYKSGDKVKESNFPPGNAEELVEQGFLKEFSKADQKKADKVANDSQIAAEQAQKDDKAKALKDAENSAEEANMAVTIEQEKVDGLETKLSGDNINAKAKEALETQLVKAKEVLGIVEKSAIKFNEKLNILKDS